MKKWIKKVATAALVAVMAVGVVMPVYGSAPGPRLRSDSEGSYDLNGILHGEWTLIWCDQDEFYVPNYTRAVVSSGSMLFISFSFYEADAENKLRNGVSVVHYTTGENVEVYIPYTWGGPIRSGRFEFERLGLHIVTTEIGEVFEVYVIARAQSGHHRAIESRFVVGSQSYSFHGLEFQMDVAPFIDARSGRTMLPLRVIGELLTGGSWNVGWDADTSTASISWQGETITMRAGEELPNNMGQAMIVDGRTFVPARFVSEMLGATIEWDANAQAVYITRPQMPSW